MVFSFSFSFSFPISRFALSSSSNSAKEAAKATLTKMADDDWLDPSTALVKIQFLLLSLQYGLVTVRSPLLAEALPSTFPDR